MQSRVVFQDAHYVVCITRAGLSVQSTRTGKGHVIPHDVPACAAWLENFETALDAVEAHALARAIYQ